MQYLRSRHYTDSNAMGPGPCCVTCGVVWLFGYKNQLGEACVDIIDPGPYTLALESLSDAYSNVVSHLICENEPLKRDEGEIALRENFNELQRKKDDKNLFMNHVFFCWEQYKISKLNRRQTKPQGW